VRWESRLAGRRRRKPTPERFWVGTELAAATVLEGRAYCREKEMKAAATSVAGMLVEAATAAVVLMVVVAQVAAMVLVVRVVSSFASVEAAVGVVAAAGAATVAMEATHSRSNFEDYDW
jgi:hypothetical protein